MYFKLDTEEDKSGWSDPGTGNWDHSYEEDIDETIVGISEAEDGKYWDVALFPGEAEPKLDDRVHIVTVVYSTGDSFGSTSGCTEHVFAFTDAEKAFKLQDLLKKDYKDKPEYNFGKGGNSFDFYGVKINAYTWKGYFERVQRVEITSLHLTKGYN